MTNNIITLPGMAPRLPGNDARKLPTLRAESEAMLDLRAKFTLSHALIMTQCANLIREGEGIDAALNVVGQLLDDLKRDHAIMIKRG